MKTTSANIHRDPDYSESLFFEYEAIKLASTEWFSNEPDTYEVNCIRMKMPLKFEPNDIEQDLRTAIAEDLGVKEYLVTIECLIEYLPMLTREQEDEIIKQHAA